MANSGQGSDIRRMQENDMLPGQRQMLPLALGADRIVAINRETIFELQEVGVSLERIVTIPNGVETDSLNYKRAYTINGQVTVIFVGRLHPSKGVEVLLGAFNQVVLNRPDMGWRLWILGEGPLKPELELMARQLGIAQQVKFWGRVDDVPVYLTQADLFVLPSRTEGISNALLEAMAHGLPCVATRIGGNVDLIRHGENGLLVKPESESELVEAIKLLATDENLRCNVGKVARQTIEREYSLESVVRRYITLYKSLF